MKHSLLLMTFVLLLAGCTAGQSPVDQDASQEESQGKLDGNELRQITYENQERNQPCRRDADCIEGLRCKDAGQELGTCQIFCRQDGDCGNGFLCRNETCQADCAGIGEKCSDRRECCYFDTDNDNLNNASCKDNGTGDVRCRVE